MAHVININLTNNDNIIKDNYFGILSNEYLQAEISYDRLIFCSDRSNLTNLW